MNRKAKALVGWESGPAVAELAPLETDFRNAHRLGNFKRGCSVNRHGRDRFPAYSKNDN